MVAVDSEFKFLLDWLSSFRAVTDLGFPTSCTMVGMSDG